MDEALKKFYFDLYDGGDGDAETQDAPSVSHHDSQSFNIDDYFDSHDSNTNKKQEQSSNVMQEPPKFPVNRSRVVKRFSGILWNGKDNRKHKNRSSLISKHMGAI